MDRYLGDSENRNRFPSNSIDVDEIFSSINTPNIVMNFNPNCTGINNLDPNCTGINNLNVSVFSTNENSSPPQDIQEIMNLLIEIDLSSDNIGLREDFFERTSGQDQPARSIPKELDKFTEVKNSGFDKNELFYFLDLFFDKKIYQDLKINDKNYKLRSILSIELRNGNINFGYLEENDQIFQFLAERNPKGDEYNPCFKLKISDTEYKKFYFPSNLIKVFALQDNNYICEGKHNMVDLTELNNKSSDERKDKVFQYINKNFNQFSCNGGFLKIGLNITDLDQFIEKNFNEKEKFVASSISDSGLQIG